MNIDTGVIRHLTEQEFLAAQEAGERLVPVDPELMTELQKAASSVDPSDTRSPLGRLLHESRSKYVPHVGAKQREKEARKYADHA